MSNKPRQAMYRTAKTKVQCGKIPAGTFVAISYSHTDFMGRDVYNICPNCFWAAEDTEEVLDSQIESKCF